MAQILGTDIFVNRRPESTGPVRKTGNVLLRAVGVTAAGAFALIYLTIALGMMIGGVLFLWWLSDLGYSVGWPLGFPIRIAAIIATLGLLPIVMIGFALVVGTVSLLAAPFRR